MAVKSFITLYAAWFNKERQTRKQINKQTDGQKGKIIQTWISSLE
jgi:hypothetical protein